MLSSWSDFTMITDPVKAALNGGECAQRKSAVIVGLEAHVCVQQVCTANS